MATIANLSVSITANTDKFVKGANRAIAKLGEMAASAAKWGVAAASAAAAGTAYLVQQQMQVIDATAKISDTLGISTQNLAAYQHAADLAGVSNEQLTAGLNRFIKQLPSGSDVAGSFERVAKEISSIQDPAERARAAIEVFGKSGAALIPLLASNFSDARDETEKFGLAFSRVDAAQVEAANDAITRLWGLVKGVANQIAIQLSPYIVGATNNIIQWGTEGENAGAKVLRVLDAVGSSITTAIDYLEVLRAGWHNVLGAVQSVAQSVVFVQHSLAKAAAAAAFDQSDTLNENAKRLLEVSEMYGKAATESFQSAGEAWDNSVNESHSKRWAGIFDKWQEDAQKAAAEVARSVEDATQPGKGVAGLDDLKAFAKKNNERKEKDPRQQEIGGFRQFSQRLISVTGLSMLGKKMEVHDPQLKETNKLLKEIAGSPDEGMVYG